MKFIETAELKKGMRLARPIYNKSGVLLFERNSKLTAQTIESVRNFGLLGVYILEPAEPLPPISEEDLDFERFQIMTVFAMQDELQRLLATGRTERLPSIVSLIIKKYSDHEGKVNFYQNLRSRDDYVCSHSLNVAILCTLIANAMDLLPEERLQAVQAAVLHDIGKLRVPKEILFAKEATKENRLKIYLEQAEGLGILEEALPDGERIRKICLQALKLRNDLENGHKATDTQTLIASRVLTVADRYDELTAMDFQGKAESEVKAILEFKKYQDVYDPKVVDALIRSVNILVPGVSVELNTREKALVLIENEKDILRPTLLMFRDNSILDLALERNASLYIVDIMKTMDNRYIMDRETVNKMLNQRKEESNAHN